MLIKHERTKSFILVILILCSLALAGKIWFDEKLWPVGYNFFVSRMSGLIARPDVYSMPMSSLSKPQMICLNTGHARYVHPNSARSFDEVFNEVKASFLRLLTDPSLVEQKTVTTEDEWFESLGRRSIYIDYPLIYTSKLFGEIMGVYDIWQSSEIVSVKDFLIAEDAEGGLVFYIKDYGFNTIHKYYLGDVDLREFDVIIDKYPARDDFMFSYELLLDRAPDEAAGIQQKVFIEPMVLIPMDLISTNPIVSSNPLETGGNIEQALKVFSYGAIGRYTDQNNIKMFVENYSTLKAHPNGVLEYQAVDREKGLKLVTVDGAATLYESLNACIKFVETLWWEISPGAPLYMVVTSDLIENTQRPGTYRFTLDYYYNGLPVTVMIDDKNMAEPMQHAVEIDISNGYLTRYRHYLREFEDMDDSEQEENITMVNALDGIIEQLSESGEETRVSEMFLSFIEKGEDVVRKANWCMKIVGSDDIIVYEQK